MFQIVLLVALVVLAFVSRTTEAVIAAIIAILVLLAGFYIHRLRGGRSLLEWLASAVGHIVPDWFRSAVRFFGWIAEKATELSSGAPPAVAVEIHVTVDLDRLATALRRLVAGLERVVAKLDELARENKPGELREIPEQVLRFLQLVGGRRSAADEAALLKVIDAEFDNMLAALDVELLQWTPDAAPGLWRVVEVSGLSGPETRTPAICGQHQHLAGIVRVPPREGPP